MLNFIKQCLAAFCIGTILFLLWTVTDHVFAHQNENLLIFNPLWLALVVLVPIFLTSGRAAGATRAIALAIAALAAIALLAHFVGLSSQNNLPVIALGLPPTLALALVTARRPVQASRPREALRPAPSIDRCEPPEVRHLPRWRQLAVAMGLVQAEQPELHHPARGVHVNSTVLQTANPNATILLRLGAP